MSEWGEIELGLVSEIVMGQSPPGWTYSEDGVGMPLINGPVEYGKKHPTPVQWTSAPAKTCLPGDILFCVRGSTTGRINVSNDFYCIGRGVAAIRGKNGVAVTDFLEFVLRQLAVEVLEEARGSGSTFPSVTGGRLASSKVILPPPPEQRRIATILTTMDEVIEATEKLVEKHQQIKAGLMHDLFTRGLWTRPELARGDHQGTPAEATAQEGQLRPTPEEARGLYQDSPIGMVPREWEVDRAGNLLARIEQGWSPDCESVPPEGNEWGVLKTSAVIWDGFEPRESKRLPSHLWPRTEYKVSKGDVLMTRAGPNSRVGVVALVDTAEGNLMISDKIYRCVPNDRVEPEFLVLALTSEGTQHVLEGYKTGLAESQTNISQAIVRKLWIPLPKTDERTLICKLAATVTSQLRATSTHLAKLRQQKQGLMHDLLTGRVRVNLP
jgi:type I restriction enzyme S subunit